MSKRNASAGPDAGPDPSLVPAAVAYHDGPPEISFAGRTWRRGQPQAVTPAEWAAMRAREDCAGFGFAEIVPAATMTNLPEGDPVAPAQD